MQIYKINFSLLTLFSLLIYWNAIYSKPRPRKRMKMSKDPDYRPGIKTLRVEPGR